jgi:hypothetical protein
LTISNIGQPERLGMMFDLKASAGIIVGCAPGIILLNLFCCLMRCFNDGVSHVYSPTILIHQNRVIIDNVLPADCHDAALTLEKTCFSTASTRFMTGVSCQLF